MVQPRMLAALLASALGLGFGLAAATRAAAEPGPPGPIELKPKTLEAYERYIRLTDARNDEELRQGTPELWVDGLPEPQRAAVYAEIRQGKVRIERLETREAGQPIPCPDGLVHHWVGIVFIPGATLAQTLGLVQDYDHHASYYAPEVRRAKLLERNGNDFRIFLRFQRKKVITVVLNTEHEVHYFAVDAAHARSRSHTTRIAEVENHDKSSEREKPVGNDGGYLWRMDTYWRYVERDGGIYVQCEAVSLTRDIPRGLGWLIGPYVTSIPRESLTFTLTATRAAVERQAGARGAP